MDYVGVVVCLLLSSTCLSTTGTISVFLLLGRRRVRLMVSCIFTAGPTLMLMRQGRRLLSLLSGFVCRLFR